MDAVQFYSYFLAFVPPAVLPLMPGWRSLALASVGSTILLGWLYYRLQVEACVDACGEAFVVVPAVMLATLVCLVTLVTKAIIFRDRSAQKR